MTHFSPRNLEKSLEVGLFTVSYSNNTGSVYPGDYFDLEFHSGNMTGFSGSGTSQLTFSSGNYIFEAGLGLNKCYNTYSIRAPQLSFHYILECDGLLEGTLGTTDANVDDYTNSNDFSYLNKNSNTSFNIKFKLIDLKYGLSTYTALPNRTLPYHSFMTVWREV